MQTQRTFSATTDAPRIARGLLADHTRFLTARLREDAEIIISELVTNALVHGRAPITVELTTRADRVRIEVHDTHQVLPDRTARCPGPTKTSGRGLLIIDALSTRWGITATDDSPGKTVWCELHTSEPPIADRQTRGSPQSARVEPVTA